MASSTRLRDRIFAGFGAVLFLGSAVAVSAYYVATSHSSSDTTNPQTAQQTCSDSQKEPTFAAPEAYKPEGAVTELQTTDLQEGSGPAAKDGDCLVVKYYGTLATTGAKFDENYTDTTAFAFKLGQGQVIQGWDKGMVGMKAGGTRRLVIPAAQAYGAQSPSEDIPANSDLVFEVKLLRIQS
jgi:FKBP-type peptidyl-prolyl cis-trans isomerase